MVMIQLSFEFHKAADTRGMNATEPWRGVCVLKTQGVFCNLFFVLFLTLHGLELIKTNSVLANFYNPMPLLILNN